MFSGGTEMEHWARMGQAWIEVQRTILYGETLFWETNINSKSGWGFKVKS